MVSVVSLRVLIRILLPLLNGILVMVLKLCEVLRSAKVWKCNLIPILNPGDIWRHSKLPIVREKRRYLPILSMSVMVVDLLLQCFLLRVIHLPVHLQHSLISMVPSRSIPKVVLPIWIFLGILVMDHHWHPVQQPLINTKDRGHLPLLSRLPIRELRN